MKTEHRKPQFRRDDGAPAVPVQPGGLLGNRYELGPRIGRGGMAEVREGWDVKLGRPVAIKLLHPEGGARQNDRLRFETEARATAKLSSQHIVVVHDVGEHHGVPFIVMERLPGVSLADHIARGPLPPAFVHTVLDGVLAALTAAHDAGILHRDVKPGNILFTATGEAKLADFGIAKTTGVAHTMTGHVVGTMAYMSPDRLTGKPATPADDLYAVGVVGYEALTGQRPFRQVELGALAYAILHESPPPLAALRPDVHPGLSAAIERAMARNPAQKFGRASAMRAALVSADPATVALRKPTRVMTPPLPPAGTSAFVDADLEDTNPRRKLWAAAILATCLLAVMLLAVSPSLSAPPPAPASTTTPLPPPATAEMTTSSDPGPPPALPPDGPGKKPKGGKGH